MTDRRHPVSRRKAVAFLGGLALSVATVGNVAANEGQLRIAKQFGVVYLLLNVVEDQKLIEKHGKQAGLDIKVEYVQLSGGPAVNDALLSGNIEIAGAGVGPLFTLWDRTRGRQNVKGVASLGNFPYYLVTNNPDVKTIADFTEKDRIALPAVGVSVQARILQLASAKQWGDKEFARLDKISVAVPHPEAAAAIIKGGTEISGHFGNPPFQEQELAENPKARIVLNSYDVQGGPASSTVLYATDKFYKNSPKTYKAFLDALDDAAKFITENPEKAAEIYLRINNSKLDPALLTKIITNPAVTFKVTPENTIGLGKFMHRVGAIKAEPLAIGDYFFDDPRISSGS
ncbi:ABC transporter substrate-binding protein [Methylobacterium sp. 77]|uniref:ABC transporter substrate-binding protein n=1 Tax=Methylobacterium sp. 77 TaxID=1101192 RepID=UPI00037B5D34|nr:ABC transporter substrate-binding protein [Methylobacterium sp. 77]